MREWHHIHEQISNILKSQGIRNENKQNQKNIKDRYATIHQSVLSGYLSNIALKKEKNIYLAARGREAMLFPGSTCVNLPMPIPIGKRTRDRSGHMNRSACTVWSSFQIAPYPMDPLIRHCLMPSLSDLPWSKGT